jgi:hypothetical protein
MLRRRDEPCQCSAKAAVQVIILLSGPPDHQAVDRARARFLPEFGDLVEERAALL